MKKESLIQLYFTFQIHTLTEEVHFSKTSRNLFFFFFYAVWIASFFLIFSKVVLEAAVSFKMSFKNDELTLAAISEK